MIVALVGSSNLVFLLIVPLVAYCTAVHVRCSEVRKDWGDFLHDPQEIYNVLTEALPELIQMSGDDACLILFAVDMTLTSHYCKYRLACVRFVFWVFRLTLFLRTHGSLKTWTMLTRNMSRRNAWYAPPKKLLVLLHSAKLRQVYHKIPAVTYRWHKCRINEVLHFPH